MVINHRRIVLEIVLGAHEQLKQTHLGADFEMVSECADEEEEAVQIDRPPASPMISHFCHLARHYVGERQSGC